MSGPQCCSNPPTINPSTGSGHVEKLGGLDSYVTGFPDSKLAILLVSDIFGTCPPFQKPVSVFFFSFGLIVRIFTSLCDMGFVVLALLCI